MTPDQIVWAIVLFALVILLFFIVMDSIHKQQMKNTWASSLAPEETRQAMYFQRIYYPNLRPTEIMVSRKWYDRKNQDPKNCTTIGWIVYDVAYNLIRIDTQGELI